MEDSRHGKCISFKLSGGSHTQDPFLSECPPQIPAAVVTSLEGRVGSLRHPGKWWVSNLYLYNSMDRGDSGL